MLEPEKPGVRPVDVEFRPGDRTEHQERLGKLARIVPLAENVKEHAPARIERECRATNVEAPFDRLSPKPIAGFTEQERGNVAGLDEAWRRLAPPIEFILGRKGTPGCEVEAAVLAMGDGAAVCARRSVHVAVGHRAPVTVTFEKAPVEHREEGFVMAHGDHSRTTTAGHAALRIVHARDELQLRERAVDSDDLEHFIPSKRVIVKPRSHHPNPAIPRVELEGLPTAIPERRCARKRRGHIARWKRTPVEALAGGSHRGCTLDGLGAG